MSTTLSYGYKKPQQGDRGSTFFPDLEADIQQLNDHSHNGINSTKLTIEAVAVTTQAISSGSWAATSGGTYKQTVTMPGSLVYDNVGMEFRITSSKHIIYPTIEKVSANTYDIYINDNSVDVTAVYTS